MCCRTAIFRLASRDPVAIDRASVDLIKEESLSFSFLQALLVFGGTLYKHFA